MHKFGKFLEFLMDERSVWRKDLIAGTGFSKSKVAAHLAGEREPSMADRSNYAEAMGLSAEEFERRYQVYKNPGGVADMAGLQRLMLDLPVPLFSQLRTRFQNDDGAIIAFCIAAIGEKLKAEADRVERHRGKEQHGGSQRVVTKKGGNWTRASAR